MGVDAEGVAWVFVEDGSFIPALIETTFTAHVGQNYCIHPFLHGLDHSRIKTHITGSFEFF